MANTAGLYRRNCRQQCIIIGRAKVDAARLHVEPIAQFFLQGEPKRKSVAHQLDVLRMIVRIADDARVAVGAAIR